MASYNDPPRFLSHLRMPQISLCQRPPAAASATATETIAPAATTTRTWAQILQGHFNADPANDPYTESVDPQKCVPAREERKTYHAWASCCKRLGNPIGKK